MKGEFVLDTSALMTYIQNEPGADEVGAIVHDGVARVPWSVLLELYYIALQERDEDEALFRYAAIKGAPGIQVVWDITEPILLTAARIKAANRLSFADALIAAYAVEEHAILVHKDPEFDALGDLISVVRLPYKEKTKPDAR